MYLRWCILGYPYLYGGNLKLYLPSQRIYTQPYAGCRETWTPPSDQSPLWLQPRQHPLEGALPARGGDGLGVALRLGTARVNRRVRGRAQYRLTLSLRHGAPGRRKVSPKKQLQEIEGKGEVRLETLGGRRGEEAGRDRVCRC